MTGYQKPVAWGGYQDGSHLNEPLLIPHQTHCQSVYKVLVLLLSSLQVGSFCSFGSIHDVLYADMFQLQALYHIVAAFVLEVSVKSTDRLTGSLLVLKSGSYKHHCFRTSFLLAEPTSGHL